MAASVLKQDPHTRKVKRLKRTLLIVTKYNMRIFGAVPLIKLQKTIKQQQQKTKQKTNKRLSNS